VSLLLFGGIFDRIVWVARTMDEMWSDSILVKQTLGEISFTRLMLGEYG